MQAKVNFSLITWRMLTSHLLDIVERFCTHAGIEAMRKLSWLEDAAT